jgi:hypothetical protein
MEWTMASNETKQTQKANVASRGEIGRLTLDVDPEALKQVIASGRLMEFAATMANEAAAQISAQLVDKVADMAIGGSSGSGISASFVLEGGDFGTVPPRPKFGVGPLRRFDNILQRIAAPAADLPGAG